VGKGVGIKRFALRELGHSVVMEGVEVVGVFVEELAQGRRELGSALMPFHQVVELLRDGVPILGFIEPPLLRIHLHAAVGGFVEVPGMGLDFERGKTIFSVSDALFDRMLTPAVRG